MLLLTMSWEDNEDLLPSQQQPSPAPASGGLNPNASSFSFNPGASTFAPTSAPSPPPVRASQHAAAVAPTQPTPHENSHIEHPASHSALPNGIAPMDEDEPAAVPDSTAGPSGTLLHPGHKNGNLILAACHIIFMGMTAVWMQALFEASHIVQGTQLPVPQTLCRTCTSLQKPHSRRHPSRAPAQLQTGMSFPLALI